MSKWGTMGYVPVCHQRPNRISKLKKCKQIASEATSLEEGGSQKVSKIVLFWYNWQYVGLRELLSSDQWRQVDLNLVPQTAEYSAAPRGTSGFDIPPGNPSRAQSDPERNQNYHRQDQVGWSSSCSRWPGSQLQGRRRVRGDGERLEVCGDGSRPALSDHFHPLHHYRHIRGPCCRTSRYCNIGNHRVDPPSLLSFENWKLFACFTTPSCLTFDTD